MTNRNATIITLLLAVVLSISIHSAAFAKGGQHVGYLSDVMCANNKVSAGGFDLITNPEKHTVFCMKMPPCEASGYGIFIKNTQTAKYEFTKFDTKGTEFAKKLLSNTEKKDNVKIQVTRTVDNGVLMVENIRIM